MLIRKAIPKCHGVSKVKTFCLLHELVQCISHTSALAWSSLCSSPPMTEDVFPMFECKMLSDDTPLGFVTPC